MIGALLSFALVGGLTLLLTAGSPSQASARLTADQVAIVANHNSEGSLDVARHYAKKRGIPASHVIEVALPLDETISRKDYLEQVLTPVRHALVNRRLTKKIRVLVTTYGVPLRIEGPKIAPHEERWLKDAEERRRFAEAYLERAEDALAKIAPSGSSSGEAGQPWPARIERAVRSAAQRLQEAQDRKEAEQGAAELTRLVRLVGGQAALVQRLTPSPGGDAGKAQAEIAKLRQQVDSAGRGIHMLTEAPSDANRQRAYKLAEQFFGLLGILRQATVEMNLLSYKDSDASLDSELSLLWWDADFYPLTGHLTNPLHHELWSPGAAPAPLVPVLMVSRLDAPSAQAAKGLVDQALAAEKQGLTGKVYLDARGLKPEPAYGYGFYDESLRNLAALFRTRTSYPVVLEDTDRRFSQPGEASDVAVYVGWYKLRDYEDAFTFLHGAIGYHIASGEAVSLHDALERGWCKNALERGIAVTIGSVGEPYVDAFPPPSQFLGLMLTGRYDLVEAYYLTSRHLSWRMVLVGDPLYNPWRGKALVGEKDLSLRAGSAGPTPLPLPPSEGPFPDPIAASKQVREQRQALIARIDQFLGQLDKPDVQSSHPDP